MDDFDSIMKKILHDAKVSSASGVSLSSLRKDTNEQKK